MFIYVIGDERGRVKVGWTKCPETRRRFLQTGAADELRLVFFRRIRTPWKAEARVHKALIDHHVRGEWFSVSEEKAVAAVWEAITGLGLDAGTRDEVSGLTAAKAAKRLSEGGRVNVAGAKQTTLWFNPEANAALIGLAKVIGSITRAVNLAIEEVTPEDVRGLHSGNAIVNRAVIVAWAKRNPAPR